MQSFIYNYPFIIHFLPYVYNEQKAKIVSLIINLSVQRSSFLYYVVAYFCAAVMHVCVRSLNTNDFEKICLKNYCRIEEYHKKKKKHIVA